LIEHSGGYFVLLIIRSADGRGRRSVMTRVGSTFKWALTGGDSVVFVVKAIRWGPFSYVEAESVNGGKRVQVPLRVVDQCIADRVLLDELASSD